METYAEKRFGSQRGRSDSFGEDESDRIDAGGKKNTMHRSVVVGKGKGKSTSPGKIKEIATDIMGKMGD